MSNFFILSFLLIIILNSTISEQNLSFSNSNLPNYCGEYVECAAVSLLEERLCLGNSLWRPFWLPQKRDPFNCHKKLKNDYITLERLEEEQDEQLNACLNENSKPLDRTTAEECQLINSIPRFSYGRSITYVPNHCFTGLKRRIERQCGELLKCCPPINNCRLLSIQSNLQKLINSTRENLKKRAKDCENGFDVAPLLLDTNIQFSTDENSEQVWAPTGNINVRVHHQPINNASGFVNVRFSTLPENEEKARKLLIRYGDKTPKLSYPESRVEFEKKFDKAITNTNKYKEQIDKFDRNLIAKEGFESLIDAATVSETVNMVPPMGTVTHLSSNDDQNLIIDNFDDNHNQRSFSTTSESVTTSPIIFVEKYAKPQKNMTIKCQKNPISKAIKFSNILIKLGENPHSKDLKEIRKLIENFEEKLKKKQINEKNRLKAQKVEKDLEILIQKFDENSFKNIQKDAEEILENSPNLESCGNDVTLRTEIEISDSLDGSSSDSTMLVDDNGDKYIIEKGATTLIVGGPPDKIKNEAKDEMKNFISNEYRKEIEHFRKEQNLWSTKNQTNFEIRKETTCDMYMRCRSQMHLAVDSCAWRFASDQLLSTMAESAESLLFKDDGVCSQKDGEKYETLYETIIERNDKLRKCLDEKNQKFFDESVCLAYSEHQRIIYEEAIQRLLNSSFEYKKATDCFQDANLVQQKCSNLRDCCPNFHECREKTFDSEAERIIINLTATLNDVKQECVKQKAKNAVKDIVRQLLLSSKSGKKFMDIAQIGLDISKGARVVRMAKYRV